VERALFKRGCVRIVGGRCVSEGACGSQEPVGKGPRI
jgi:hypothetical protein